MTETAEIEQKVENLRMNLSEILSASTNPVLLWSGGLDSTLLLKLSLEICPELIVIQFRQDMTAEQLEFSDSVIREDDFRTIYYAPASRYFASEGENIALIDEYSIGKAVLPVIRDCVHSGDICGLELSPRRTPHFDYRHDVSIVGWRESDAHAVLTGNLPPEIVIGNSQFVAPLFHLSDEEIREMSESLLLPQSEFYESRDEKLDTGNVIACTRCIGTSERVFCPKKQEFMEGVAWARKVEKSDKEVNNARTV